jgi:hypothetical protein
MKLPLLLLSCTPLLACATATTYRADSALLIPWTEEAQRRLPSPPYAARYEHEGKLLTYVASRHEHQSGCATFEVVESVFEALAPEVVIIEGLGRDRGFSPEGYSEWAGKMSGDDGAWPGGEAAYSASLALARGIPFVGAEPSRLEMRAALAESEFDLQDLIYYVTVRQIPQWKRTGEDEGKTFDGLFAEFIAAHAPAYDADPDRFSNLAAFKGWYEEKNGVPFVYQEITTQTCAPIDSEGASYLNRISVHVGVVRDAKITAVIAEMLNRYDRVLVVYGAGHHVQQGRVLEEMLGEPHRILSTPPPAGAYSVSGLAR